MSTDNQKKIRALRGLLLSVYKTVGLAYPELTLFNVSRLGLRTRP